MIVYTYDRATGEYLDQMLVQKHPLRDEYLIPPSNTVAVAPPTVGTNQVAKVNSNGDGWTVVVDYRGVVYYLPDGSKHEIDQLGTEPPQDALDAPPPPTQAELKARATNRIDDVAGQARGRFATNSQFIESEYQRAYATAVEYINAGYTGDVPAPVQSHVDAFGETPQVAADNIKATGDAWNQVLDSIRDIRLKGKQVVENAPEDIDIEALAQPFIDQLEELKP